MEKMTRESPIISVRVTGEELGMLEAIIAREKTRMEQAGFMPNVTAAGLFRLWLREKAKAAGLMAGVARTLEPVTAPLFPEPDSAPAVEVPILAAVPVTAPAPAPAGETPVEVPVPAAAGDDVRNRIARALESKVFPSQNAFARAAGVDSGSLSRFRQGKSGIGPEKLAVLDRVLREAGV